MNSRYPRLGPRALYKPSGFLDSRETRLAWLPSVDQAAKSNRQSRIRMLKSLEVALRSEGGVNVTGGEEGEGKEHVSQHFQFYRTCMLSSRQLGLAQSLSIYVQDT